MVEVFRGLFMYEGLSVFSLPSGVVTGGAIVVAPRRHTLWLREIFGKDTAQ